MKKNINIIIKRINKKTDDKKEKYFKIENFSDFYNEFEYIKEIKIIDFISLFYDKLLYYANKYKYIIYITIILIFIFIKYT